MRNVCYKLRKYVTKFHFSTTWDYKEITKIIICNVLRIHQKHRNRNSLRTKHFFFKQKNHSLDMKGYSMAKINFLTEVTVSFIGDYKLTPEIPK